MVTARGTRAKTRRTLERVRGAAMVESVIVISTLLVFMGLIVFMRKSYGAKLDIQQTTRANVLYYASHGCTGDRGQASLGTGSDPLHARTSAPKTTTHARADRPRIIEANITETPRPVVKGVRLRLRATT